MSVGVRRGVSVGVGVGVGVLRVDMGVGVNESAHLCPRTSWISQSRRSVGSMLSSHNKDASLTRLPTIGPVGDGPSLDLS